MAKALRRVTVLCPAIWHNASNLVQMSLSLPVPSTHGRVQIGVTPQALCEMKSGKSVSDRGGGFLSAPNPRTLGFRGRAGLPGTSRNGRIDGRLRATRPGRPSFRKIRLSERAIMVRKAEVRFRMRARWATDTIRRPRPPMAGGAGKPHAHAAPCAEIYSALSRQSFSAAGSQ